MEWKGEGGMTFSWRDLVCLLGSDRGFVGFMSILVYWEFWESYVCA